MKKEKSQWVLQKYGHTIREYCEQLYANKFFFFCFSGPHPQHMEVPRLGIKSELQLQAYTTATQDPSHICDLYRSSWQHQVYNPLSAARDRTCILVDTSWICFC